MVTGLAGTGKSALCKFAVNVVQDRNTFSGGVIYVNARHLENSDEFYSSLVSAIRNDESGQFKAEPSLDPPLKQFNDLLEILGYNSNELTDKE